MRRSEAPALGLGHPPAVRHGSSLGHRTAHPACLIVPVSERTLGGVMRRVPPPGELDEMARTPRIAKGARRRRVVRAGSAALLAALASLLALALAEAGCSAVVQEQEEAELRVPFVRSPSTFDPAHSTDIEDHNVLRLLFEGLVEYDPASLAAPGQSSPLVVPILAETYRSSPDGLLWEFVLRSGVRFVDNPCFPQGRGREIDPTDVKYSIERGLRALAGPGPYADLPPLVGLSEFLSGGAKSIEGIEAASQRTVRLRLTKRDPTLIYFLTGMPCRVVAREAVDGYGAEIRGHPVGCGPYRLASFDEMSGIALVRNRDYWRRDTRAGGLPRIPAIWFIPAASKEQLTSPLSGEADVIVIYRAPLASAAASPRAEGGLAESLLVPTPLGEAKHFLARYLNTTGLGYDFRSTHPVVRSRGLRAAVAMAIERPQHYGAKGLFPPGLWNYDPEAPGQSFDIARAAEILTAEGYPGARGLPRLRIGSATTHTMRDEAFEPLRRLGMEVPLRRYPPERLAEAVERGEVDLFRWGWMADYPDPQTFLQLFYSGSSHNTGHYGNTEFDRLFESLRAEDDPSLRRSLAAEMERILIADAAAVFIEHDFAYHVVSPAVTGYQRNCTNPLNIRFYEYVRKASPAGAARP